ncbi:MAG TPA: class I SAM-dependent methyltransferase [Pirellulales bacterium]|jgi:tRNA (cmo5U34)-methyltransferase|nr:class I SAM-dependent methyltransferase [Pirellulales bacterium]
MKSSVEEIRQRFDSEVERFSNLQTGQSATVDAPLALELIAAAAASTNPQAKRLLDIGCGAGNYTLKLLERLPKLNVTLIDLSQPMLDKAQVRIRAVSPGSIRALQGDMREIDLGEAAFDIIVASATLHHLRTDDQWRAMFAKIHRALVPGGSLWIFDLIDYDLPNVRELMKQRYAEYLEALKGPEYCADVFAYIEKEDTPKSLIFQLELLRAVGFRTVEVLHANCCFAAFGAVK